MRRLTESVVVCIGLTLLVFGSFYYKESGDMGTVMLGTVLYVPYVLILTVYNMTTQAALRMIDRQSMEIIVLPLVPLFLWMMLSGGVVVIRYWEMGYGEMLMVIASLGILNWANHRCQRNNKDEHG